jgi:hypothetical protein
MSQQGAIQQNVKVTERISLSISARAFLSVTNDWIFYSTDRSSYGLHSGKWRQYLICQPAAPRFGVATKLKSNIFGGYGKNCSSIALL